MKDYMYLFVALAGLALLAGCAREPVLPTPFGDLTRDLRNEYEVNAPPPPMAGTPRELQAMSREQLIAGSGVTRAARNNPFALFG